LTNDESLRSMWTSLNEKRKSRDDGDTNKEQQVTESATLSSSSSSSASSSPSSSPSPRSRISVSEKPSRSSMEIISFESKLDLTKFVSPLLLILQQTCFGFDITSRAIQIVACMAEYLIRYVIIEASRTARYNPPHTLTPVQVQAAVRKILPPELARDAVRYATDADTSPLQNDVARLVHAAALELLQPAWGVALGANADHYIAGVLVYVASQALISAASYAHSIDRVWVIRGGDVNHIADSLCTAVSPLFQVIQGAAEKQPNTLESIILAPPCPPRDRAADKIYLTSIIHETPLQADNQLLIVFLLLASLSLRAIVA